MTVNYCPACNERISQADDLDACPRCGVRLEESSLHNFDETQDLGGPVQTQIDGGQGAKPRELDHLVGQQVGVYLIESVLGHGGMGHVFVAKHQHLQRRCALKILSPQTAQRDQEYVERFRHEGRAAASLNHPNVTIIHAIGEEDGLHFLEMEMLTGGALQQLVAREGRLSPARAAKLMVHASAGMAAAHAEGLVHRDLKPDNILLTDDHQPKIADFGLAKRVAAANGKLAGTPNYMAPELFDGAPATLASDVYALGATFFMLLAGRVPFAAKSLQDLMQQAKHSPLPELDALGVSAPAVVTECLRQLLAKDPQQRCPDASGAVQLLSSVVDVVRDLRTIVADAFTSSRHVQWNDEQWKDEQFSLEQCELTVQLPQGRSQTVFLERAEPANDGHEHLLLIYSVCCPRRAQLLRKGAAIE